MSRTRQLSACTLVFLCFAVSPVLAKDVPKENSTLGKHLKQLNQLVDVFVRTAKAGDQFGADFWKASKILADSEGPAIVHAVMEQAKGWTGEEEMLYWPLMALLPRNETVKLLERYKRSNNKKQQVAAEEILGSFECADVKDGVKLYSHWHSNTESGKRK